jgi:hypothetical protein
MRKVLFILSFLLCSFSVCMAGNKSIHAPSSDCPAMAKDFNTSQGAYAAGYYGTAIDLSGDGPPNLAATVCRINVNDPDNLLKNLCLNGIRDALKDQSKALRCWAKVQREIERK